MAWWHEKAAKYERRVIVDTQGATHTEYWAVLEGGQVEQRTRQAASKAGQEGTLVELVVEVPAGAIVRRGAEGEEEATCPKS